MGAGGNHPVEHVNAQAVVRRILLLKTIWEAIFTM